MKIRSRFELLLYLYKSDDRYMWKIWTALFAAFGGLAVLIFTPAKWYWWLLSATLLAVTFSGLLKVLMGMRFRPAGQRTEYFTRQKTHLELAGREIALRDLEPALAEQELGFRRVFPKGSNEVAHTSDEINGWLGIQPVLAFKVSGDSFEGILRRTPDDDFRFYRLAWLRSLVLSRRSSNEKEVTNEKKYTLDEIPAPGLEALTIRKVGYYDSLVTNQLANRELRLRQTGISEIGVLKADFSRSFPIPKAIAAETSSVQMLPYGTGNIKYANGVGVSTLAVTKDGYPVFFRQRKANVEGADKVTVASGSADFQDTERRYLKPDETAGADLREVVKYGMVREMLEECSLPRHPRFQRKQRDHLFEYCVRNTLITGYFRWVRRAGKPEFLAITHLPVPLQEITPLNDEVASISGGTFSTEPIQRVSDLGGLLNSLNNWAAAHKDTIRLAEDDYLGLSSAMVLWRLEQITKRVTDADRALCQRISTLLNIEDA